MRLLPLLLALCSLATANLRADDGTPLPLRFNQEIRPILSEKCFQCHGPDPKKRDSGLRLDVADAAIADRKGVRAIVPGQPDASELMRRITSDDPDEVMPPPSAKIGTLSPAEVATLGRWIAEGAPFEKHWAFNSLQPPQAAHFDDLVAQGLTQRGLAFQPEANPTTLIRRVSFDLTGLPPTPAEVQAFVAACNSSSTPEAYERLVDRLLASPRFGERMAVDWLDIARYADSYGFQVDRDREVWPWRDWVVKAFNANLSFDQFITWQLGGDLLPHATDEQILATAFNRLHQQESEGGSVEEEYRVEYVADRVQTFSTAFLGLTFECARCHDHKFDPLTQKEYFQFFSMFQNINEAGLYSFFTPSVPTPALALADAWTQSSLAGLALKVTQEETKLAGLKPLLGPDAVVPESELAAFPFDSLEKGTLANVIDPAQPAKLKGENQLVPGRRGQAIQFTGDDPVDLPLGNFHSYEPFSVSLWLKTPDRKERAVVFHRSRAWTDAASRGYELLIEEGKLKWSLIHFWPGNAISIRAQEELQPGAWTHVLVTNDGSSRASGLRIYVNGQPAPTETLADNLTREITGGGGDHIALGERFRDRGFKGGLIDDFRVFHRELTAGEARAVASDEAAAPAPPLPPAYLAQLEVVKTARADLLKARTAQKEIMVMRELPQPKKAYVLLRGAYDQRQEEVGPGTPEVLSPFPPSAPKNRLGLAMWLTAPEHPLTARVTVNRFWQSLFGQGLVKTSEDFGSQAALPLYPEVLDWLAWHFIANGWDTKALHKTIVMSRTYRQDSVAEPKLMADDPENEQLARGPRFRLSAEMIRDNSLAAAGLLTERLGGPPVNPYEMSEAFKPVAPAGGDGVYRRSLYTTWRRTSPPPAMVTFDAPRRGICVAKRERTNSPLQALILLNGEQYVEAARVLGEKLHQEAKGDPAQMIQAGFLRCLSREPDAREREICAQLYQEQLHYFAQSTGEAQALLKTGRAPHDAQIPLPQAAAATALAQALLNHDECVVKR